MPAEKGSLDRQSPVCSNCVRRGDRCVYPPPGKAPRRPRRSQDADITDNAQSPGGSSSSTSNTPAAQNSDASGPVGIWVAGKGRNHYLDNRVLTSLVENVSITYQPQLRKLTVPNQDITGNYFGPGVFRGFSVVRIDAFI